MKPEHNTTAADHVNIPMTRQSPSGHFCLVIPIFITLTVLA